MRYAALLLMLLFAGCSESGTAPTDDFCASDCTKPEPTDTTGVLLGVVVDEAVRPISGATVVLTPGGMETETDAEGRFFFDKLEPGTYFLDVSRLGYFPVQMSQDVVAAVEPPVLKVMLKADAASLPYVEVYNFQGFIECMVGIQETPVTTGSSSANPCYLSPNSQNVVDYEVSPPTFAQTEVVWSPGLGVGESLLVSYSVTDSSHTDGQNDYAVAEGSSPLVLSANATQMEDVNVGEMPLRLRVFAGGEGGFSIHANEEFEAVTHVFYGFEPPAGWTFVRDGAPEVPS